VRLARTIADLAGEEAIAEGHVSEAIQRRRRTEP
jgi:predicted ATPase with chaperone activity